MQSVRSRTSSSEYEISTPNCSMSRGINVAGPQTMTFAPSLVSPQIFDRADPTVPNVSDQRYRQSLQHSTMLADREDIQQRLRRMLVRAVARVKDWRIEMAGQQMRRTGCTVPDDNLIDAHRFDVAGRVNECFTLRQAAATGREVNSVGAQALGGQIEAGAGPRRRFKEQIGDDCALERPQFRLALLGQFPEARGPDPEST